jgi:hypothetical protein
LGYNSEMVSWNSQSTVGGKINKRSIIFVINKVSL